MKTKLKIGSLAFLSLLYPYLLIDLMLNDTAPWKPLLSNTSFFGNNWISLIILISMFTGILYLGKSIDDVKKDEPNFILKVFYAHIITLSILVFMLIFSIFIIILVKDSSVAYFSVLYILFFPVLFSVYHYFYIIKKSQSKFSFQFNILFLFLGVVLPVIIYGFLAAIVL